MSIKLLTYQEHERQKPLPRALILPKERWQAVFNKTHRGKVVSQTCFQVEAAPNGKGPTIDTSYFVGLDWLEPQKTAISVQPKLDQLDQQVDLYQMLHLALESPVALSKVNELLQIDWEAPPIPVAQKSDFLTPLLAISYLGLLKTIVKKGLPKQHSLIDRNLHAKVKGKILVSQSIRKNLMQHKASYTFCNYPEQQLNSPANALLKKALLLLHKNLLSRIPSKDQTQLSSTLAYLNHAFKNVSTKNVLKDLRAVQNNHFYPEYTMALQMAQLLIKYTNLAFHPQEKGHFLLPPYWIDMSKLFELYVLGLFKDRFQEKIKYQVRFRGNELDYLLNTAQYKMVIDAKYKPIYQVGKVKEDMRQLSGYARLQKVHQALAIAPQQKIDCLVVYPNQENGWEQISEVDLKAQQIKDYTQMYKLGVKLPMRGIND